MTEAYTTGSWRPFPGREEAFRDEWKRFVDWASTMPGAGRAVLTRDLRDPGRYVSFMDWEDLESIRAWKGSPEFKPRMAKVQEHVDEFAPTELELVAAVGARVAS